jgi:hypothetical protein
MSPIEVKVWDSQTDVSKYNIMSVNENESFFSYQVAVQLIPRLDVLPQMS